MAIAYALRLIGCKRYAWNLMFSVGPKYGGPAPHLAEFLSDIARGGTIVEHGCGIGTLPQQLRPGSFSSYMGYDISDTAVRTANSLHVQNCRFQRQSMEAWTGEQYPVDLIVCKEVLCYLSNRAQTRFIETAMQSLRNGGILVITLHDRYKHAESVSTCHALGATEVQQNSPVILKFVRQ